jgi:urease accessory protein
MTAEGPVVWSSGRPVVGLPPGTARLEVAALGGVSRCVGSASAAPVRVLVPVTEGSAVWAYLTGFGGGVVAGDRYDVNVDVGPAARVHVGTSGATRAYRSAGSWAHLTNRIHVGSDGLAVWGCDPLAAFRGAQVVQQSRADLDADASLVWIDGLTAGRHANGESWAGTVRSRLAIDRGGTPWLRDGVHLDPPLGAQASACLGSAAFAPYTAISLVALVGPLVADLADSLVAQIAERPVVAGAPLLVTASPRDGGAVLRLAAVAQELIDRELRALLGPCIHPLLGDDPWARRP